MHFTNLSETATIKIFDLSGNLVRKLSHSGGQNAVWDLTNSFGIGVASGMYIAMVDGDGCDKVLKLAVIMPEQRIDVY